MMIENISKNKYNSQEHPPWSMTNNLGFTWSIDRWHHSQNPNSTNYGIPKTACRRLSSKWLRRMVAFMKFDKTFIFWASHEIFCFKEEVSKLGIFLSSEKQISDRVFKAFTKKLRQRPNYWNATVALTGRNLQRRVRKYLHVWKLLHVL